MPGRHYARGHAPTPFNENISVKLFTFTEIFFTIRQIIFTICLKKFVTNFVTAVTNFLTHVTNFVTRVTKFVTKTILGIGKTFRQIGKNISVKGKNFKEEMPPLCLWQYSKSYGVVLRHRTGPLFRPIIPTFRDTAPRACAENHKKKVFRACCLSCNFALEKLCIAQ